MRCTCMSLIPTTFDFVTSRCPSHCLVFAELKKKKSHFTHPSLSPFLAKRGDVSKPVVNLSGPPALLPLKHSAFHSHSAGLPAFQNVAAMPSELPRALGASRPGGTRRFGQCAESCGISGRIVINAARVSRASGPGGVGEVESLGGKVGATREVLSGDDSANRHHLNRGGAWN